MSNQTPPTILVVDDEPDILSSLRDLIEASLDGTRCLTAQSGKAALDILQKDRVDIILSDYKMPGMDGLTFLQEARRLAPKVTRVLITAFPDLDVAIKAINDAGIETFFTKPLDPDKVISALQATLKTRHERESRDQALGRALGMRKGGSA